jgi:hypothetical protein
MLRRPAFHHRHPALPGPERLRRHHARSLQQLQFGSGITVFGDIDANVSHTRRLFAPGKPCRPARDLGRCTILLSVDEASDADF